ncbi:MAG: group 1 truncated hemoglobin [Myxococcales bacterium]|nr:group 1 truncated hemoglobin [Myxococcales bacterium]
MILMSALTVASLAACGGSSKPVEATTTSGGSAAPTTSLYDRLGKMDAIKAVVKDFVEERVAKDPRINSFFLNTDIPAFEAKLAEQICEATGGPCKYTGKDMKTSHLGMKIKESDFNALVEDLIITLDKFKVPEREKAELLAPLAAMKGDIVNAP